MQYNTIIKKIFEDMKGVVSTKTLKEYNIPSIYLTRMINSGELIRVDRGIYINSGADYDEYYFLSLKSDVPIFSYVSALFLQGFTEIIPQQMEITVYNGYNTHRINNVVSHHVDKKIYNIGIIEVETPFGNKVKSYDIERTICDFIKNRNKIDRELFSKTLNWYVRYSQKNMNKLYNYSKRMNIYKKVKNILEIIYE